MGNFIDSLEAFFARNPEVAPSRLGIDAIGDGAFVMQIRKGRRPRIDTAEKVQAWMTSYERSKRASRRKRSA